MSYSVLVREYISGWALHMVELNPSNFYDAKDEEELKHQVLEYICDEHLASKGEFHIQDRELDYALPKEFIEEWKSLKGLK